MIISGSRKAHDIHVSVTDIVIDDKGLMKMTSKIFYDDLQLAMGLRPGEELPKKYKGGDDLISKFLAKHIKIKVGNTPLVYTYKSSKAALPAIWAYTEAQIDIKQLTTSLAIENSMFNSVYDDQVNMVNITVMGKTHHLSFNKKKFSEVVKLK
jgi:hypothetical protein